MNIIQMNEVLTRHVKYFQGVYPIDILPSTFVKPSIIVINLDKHYVPGSHWVSVCFSDTGYAEYFDCYIPATIKTRNHGIPPAPLNI